MEGSMYRPDLKRSSPVRGRLERRRFRPGVLTVAGVLGIVLAAVEYGPPLVRKWERYEQGLSELYESHRIGCEILRNQGRTNPSCD